MRWFGRRPLSSISMHFLTTWQRTRRCGMRKTYARLLQSTDKLTEFPRLYEAALQYGEGVRRISLLGCHVLYEVDESAHLVNVLAVVGQRQQPRMVR